MSSSSPADKYTLENAFAEVFGVDVTDVFDADSVEHLRTLFSYEARKGAVGPQKPGDPHAMTREQAVYFFAKHAGMSNDILCQSKVNAREEARVALPRERVEYRKKLLDRVEAVIAETRQDIRNGCGY